MYFGLIYDKKFIKNDRDFYGDAIIYFHPQESKEKVNQISYSVSVRSSVLTTRSLLTLTLADFLLTAVKKMSRSFYWQSAEISRFFFRC